MTAVLVGLLGALVAAALGWLGYRRGRAEASRDQAAAANVVTKKLEQHDARSREREASDVGAIRGEGEAARAGAGNRLEELLVEADDRRRGRP